MLRGIWEVGLGLVLRLLGLVSWMWFYFFSVFVSFVSLVIVLGIYVFLDFSLRKLFFFERKKI